MATNLFFFTYSHNIFKIYGGSAYKSSFTGSSIISLFYRRYTLFCMCVDFICSPCGWLGLYFLLQTGNIDELFNLLSKMYFSSKNNC